MYELTITTTRWEYVNISINVSRELSAINALYAPVRLVNETFQTGSKTGRRDLFDIKFQTLRPMMENAFLLNVEHTRNVQKFALRHKFSWEKNK